MQNEVQIAEHAVELAKWCERNGYVHPDARAILALASPPEPKRFPGVGWQPEIVKNVRGRFFVRQGDNESDWQISGPVCDAPAAAVAAWNEMIDRITGGDEETVRLMNDLLALGRWLAERKGGAK